MTDEVVAIFGEAGAWHENFSLDAAWCTRAIFCIVCPYARCEVVMKWMACCRPAENSSMAPSSSVRVVARCQDVSFGVVAISQLFSHVSKDALYVLDIFQGTGIPH